MNEELNIAGVLIPTFVAACICALLLGFAISAMLSKFVSPNIRRYVWHPPLFDFAIFVILVDISYTLMGTLLS
jgi:hypothetical protein